MRQCPNHWCRDELNVHETEWSIELYCLGGCGYHSETKFNKPHKVTRRRFTAPVPPRFKKTSRDDR